MFVRLRIFSCSRASQIWQQLNDLGQNIEWLDGMKNSGNFKNSGKLDNGYSYCYSDMHSYTKDNKFELSMLMIRNKG